jgi:hypothetical protein
MFRRVAFLTAMVGVALVLAGCALNFLGGPERRAAWRDQEERACMQAHVVPASATIQSVRKINDRGVCGIARPLKVSGFPGGRVTVGPTATLNCPMTAAVDAWLARTVQPAAIAWFGVPVVEIKQISAYACRTKNNQRGASLSEHAFGNALDIAGFRLANGRTITVKGDWNSDVYARSFLREVFAGACQQFKTVLGPGVDYHDDHFHLDLAHHGRDGTSHYCRPSPDGLPPLRQPSPGDLIARGQGLIDWGATGSIPSAAAYAGD